MHGVRMRKNKKKEELTEELVKKVMLDYSEVNTECPESVQKYAERAKMLGTLYNGYQNYEKILTHTRKKKKLLGLTPEYIEIYLNRYGQSIKYKKQEPKITDKHYSLVSQHATAEIERLISYKDEYIGESKK